MWPPSSLDKLSLPYLCPDTLLPMVWRSLLSWMPLNNTEAAERNGKNAARAGLESESCHFVAGDLRPSFHLSSSVLLCKMGKWSHLPLRVKVRVKWPTAGKVPDAHYSMWCANVALASFQEQSPEPGSQEPQETLTWNPQWKPWEATYRTWQVDVHHHPADFPFCWTSPKVPRGPRILGECYFLKLSWVAWLGLPPEEWQKTQKSWNHRLKGLFLFIAVLSTIARIWN